MAVYYEEERKKGGFWGKFLAVLLGFLFGIICTIGGLAGLGYIIYAKIKIKDGIYTVGKMTGGDIDYKEYITDEYAEKTIAELVKDLTALASDFQNGSGSLQSLANISPQVEKAAEKIVSALTDYGVPMETAVLMNTAFSQLGTFLQDSLKSAEMGTLLEKAKVLEEGSKNYSLLMQVCYGEEGVDYDLVDGKVVMKDGVKAATLGDLMDSPDALLDKVDLAAVMETTGSLEKSDPMIRAILYGTEGKTYTYDETNDTITMLPLAYDFDTTANTFTATDGVVYTYDATEEKWVNAKSGNYIAALSGEPAAAKETPASYAYCVCTKEGEIISSLALKEENTYHAYDQNDAPQYNKSLSVKQLMDAMGGSGDKEITDLFADVRLGDLLNVTPNSDDVLIALAYGTEGVDYNIENDKIVPIDGKKPATVGMLTADGGTDELFAKIELGSVMKIDLDDNVMCSLAYGTKGKNYIVRETQVPGTETPAKTVEMLPVVYTLKEDGLYNDDGEMADAVLDEATGVYTVTITEGEGEEQTTTIYYARADRPGDKAYYLYETADGADKIFYKKTTLKDLMNEPSGLLNEIELGSLMGLDGNSDKMLLSLAYGNEDEDYTIENGQIVLLGGKKPTTVGDLTNDAAASDILNDIRLGSVLGISPLDKYGENPTEPDPMMLALAYGEEGTEYIVETDEATGKPKLTWLIDEGTGEPYKPRTIGDLTKGDSSIFDTITLASVMNISADADPILLALAYGNASRYEKTESGEIVMKPVEYIKKEDGLYNDKGEKADAVLNETTGVYTVTVAAGTAEAPESETYYAKADPADEKVYYLYKTEDCAGDKIVYKKTTVADLKGDKATDLINDLELATVLALTPDSEPILISLAYGNEGEDFAYTLDAEGKKTGFQMIGDSKPRTVRELKDGKLVDTIRLGAVLGVSPLDEAADELMVALAYGNEGQHYRIVTNEETGLPEVEWQVKDTATGETYAPRTIGDLKGGSAIIEDIYLSTVLKIDGNSDEIMRALAFGNEGEDYTLDENKTVHMAPGRSPRTIKDLQKGNLVKEIRLSAVLKAKPTDKITMYLLYGVENTHYSYDETTGVTMLGRQIAVLNGFAYDERGDKLPGTLAVVAGGYAYTENAGTENETVCYLKTKSGGTTQVETETGTQTAEFYYVTDEQDAPVAYAPRTIGDLTGESTLFSDITKDLTLGDLIEINPTDPVLLHSLKDTKIEDLGGAIDTLTLVEILGATDVESNIILKHLKGSTVSTLAADITRLTIQEVFADDVYKKDETKAYFVDENGSRLYENPADGKFYTTPDFTGPEAKRVLTGTWKYLLTDKETGEEKAYTITQMGALVNNMTANIQAATLNGLYEDGIIALEKTDFLTTPVTYEFTYTFEIMGSTYTETIGKVATEYYQNGVRKEKVGELTITELLNYVGEVVGLFSASNP